MTFSDGGGCETIFHGYIAFTSSVIASSKELEQGLARELRQQTCVTVTAVSVPGM